MAFLVEDLITSSIDRTLAPISQNTFQNADIIRIANEELFLKLVSDIQGAKEDFFLSSKDVSIIAQVDHYAIPKRAIGVTLKALYYVKDGFERKLEKLDRSDADRWSGTTGSPEAFYIAGDEIILLPKPASSEGILRFSYYAKPNDLIATDSCAKITNIESASGTTTFTVDNNLSADLEIGDKIDIVSGVSPFLLWADEIEITAITSGSISVSTSDVVNAAGSVEPQLNDYICPTGFSNIPMIPKELHPVLAQMTAVRILAALGDLNKWQAAKAELNEMRREALSLIKNRVEQSPDRVFHRRGLLSSFRRF